MKAQQKIATRGKEQIPYTVSSGNVFADLGVSKPDEALLKADLARQIARIIQEKGLTQTAAATILGADQPKVSALLRGRLAGFTIDRLVRYAAALEQEVRLIVQPRAKQADGQRAAKRPIRNAASRVLSRT